MGDSIEGYEGETAERSPLVAFLLSLAAPGLGWLYLGRAGVAVALNIVSVSLWAVFVVGLAALRFHPAIPALVFGAGWMLLNLLTALDVRRAAAGIRGGYVLRDVNHPLVYGALFVFSYAIPLAALAGIAHGSVTRSVVVPDDAAWPTLVAGDRVFVDVNEFRARAPRRSDLVAFQAPDGSGLRISRVLGIEGDNVLVVHGLPVLDDVPLVQGEPTDPVLESLVAVAGPPEAGMQIQVESDGDHVYPIAVPGAVHWGDAESWQIPPGHVFLLNDNRGNVLDSRRFGAVPEELLLGIPRFVSFSVDDASPPWFLVLPRFVQHVAARLGPPDETDTWREERTARRVPTGSLR